MKFEIQGRARGVDGGRRAGPSTPDCSRGTPSCRAGGRLSACASAGGGRSGTPPCRAGRPPGGWASAQMHGASCNPAPAILQAVRGRRQAGGRLCRPRARATGRRADKRDAGRVTVRGEGLAGLMGCVSKNSPNNTDQVQ